jgi:hypothetical protein
VLVAVADEQAVGAQVAGHFEVVRCVTDDHDLLGWDRQTPDECAPQVDFALGVKILAPDDVRELAADLKVLHGLLQHGLMIGREDRLSQAQILAGL